MEPIVPWTVRGSRKLHQDRWLTVRADDCVTSDGVEVNPFYVLEYPDWAHVFALDDRERVLVVRLWRHGLGQVCTELPGGMIDRGETPEQAIRRELLEETGCAVETLERLLVASPNPSTHDNRVHCFLATGARRVQALDLDPGEQIASEFVPLEALFGLIDADRFQQAFHVGTVMLALRRLGWLDRVPRAADRV